MQRIIHYKQYGTWTTDLYHRILSDLGEPTHTLVPCWTPTQTLASKELAYGLICPSHFAPASLETQQPYRSDAMHLRTHIFLPPTQDDLPRPRSIVGFHFHNGGRMGFTEAPRRIPNPLACDRGPREGTRHEEARSSWRFQLLITYWWSQ